MGSAVGTSDRVVFGVLAVLLLVFYIAALASPWYRSDSSSYKLLDGSGSERSCSTTEHTGFKLAYCHNDGCNALFDDAGLPTDNLCSQGSSWHWQDSCTACSNAKVVYNACLGLGVCALLFVLPMILFIIAWSCCGLEAAKLPRRATLFLSAVAWIFLCIAVAIFPSRLPSALAKDATTSAPCTTGPCQSFTGSDSVVIRGISGPDSVLSIKSTWGPDGWIVALVALVLHLCVVCALLYARSSPYCERASVSESDAFSSSSHSRVERATGFSSYQTVE